MCCTLGASFSFSRRPIHEPSHDTGASIAEIVSAFPTCGGLRVSPATFPGVTLAHNGPGTGILHPRSSCPRSTGQLYVLLWPVQQTRLFKILEVGWLVGWLNIL